MKRVKIAVMVALVALLGVIAWPAFDAGDDPLYKGRTLTSWLKSWYRIDGGKLIFNQQSEEAIRQIGTNGIPTLLRLLRARDSAFKIKVINLLQWQHVVDLRFRHASSWHGVTIVAFSVLNTNAQTARARIDWNCRRAHFPHVPLGGD